MNIPLQCTLVITGAMLLQRSADVECLEGRDSVDRDTREMAREARTLGPPATATLFAESVVAAKPTVKLTVGGAYDNAQGTKTANVPFSVSYKTAVSDSDPLNWWQVKVAGDGFVHSEPRDGGNQAGFADVKLSVNRQLSSSTLLNVGVTVPSRGEVGSTAYAQFLKLSYTHDFPGDWRRWSIVAIGGATHYNAAKPGTSARKALLYGEVDYKIDDARTILVNLTRTRRNGVGQFTEVGTEYDFPLGAKSRNGAFVVSRGVTSGARHTSIGLEVTIKFSEM